MASRAVGIQNHPTLKFKAALPLGIALSNFNPIKAMNNYAPRPTTYRGYQALGAGGRAPVSWHAGALEWGFNS
jgi:hypothetical protein